MKSNFSIKVINRKPKRIQGLIACEGEIRIKDFKETFVMPLTAWSLEDYEKQWQEGINRIKAYDVSCLVATVQIAKKAIPLINWWVLYKEGNIIYIQNELIVDTEYEATIGNNAFTPENCYQYIDPKRTTISEGGYKISEWSVRLDEIKALSL